MSLESTACPREMRLSLDPMTIGDKETCANADTGNVVELNAEILTDGSGCSGREVSTEKPSRTGAEMTTRKRAGRPVSRSMDASIRNGLTYRSSCNECNSAKVKCSKIRPSCKRCETRGTKCVYGLSLRSVRRKSSIVTEPNTPTEVQFPPNCSLFHAGLDSEITEQRDSASSEDVACPPGSFSSPIDLPNLSFDEWDFAFGLSETIPDQRLGLYSNALPEPDVSPTVSRCHITKSTNSTNPTRCRCQQDLTAKLLYLSTIASSIDDIPFDNFLTDNKDVIPACSSTLECSNSSHKKDLPLLATFVALLSQLVILYERILASRSLKLPRLSFGSYQLDQEDQRILQANLVKIELSKIDSIIKAFDEQFCTTPATPPLSVMDPDIIPIAPLLGHVKRILRTGFEAVQGWN